MSYPTRGEVKDAFLFNLDDPPPDPPIPGVPIEGSVYTDRIFQRFFQQAFDVLYAAMLTQQVPRVELMTNTLVPIGTTELTPADFGVADFGDFIFLRERAYGSNDRYTDMAPVDVLSQRQPTTKLIEFNWRNNTFYFIGATNNIDLEVKYDSSGRAPTDDATQIAVDASLNFLSNFTAGAASRTKGDWESMGAACMLRAVGPRFEQGEIGGYLRQIVAPLVRSRQHVQIAPKPYSASRRFQYRRAIPWVAAQGGTTGGGNQNVPVQFSTATGTIIGVIDGVNDTFTLNMGVTSIEFIARNGVVLTRDIDYTVLGNQFKVSPGDIPQPGNPPDILTAEAWPKTSP